MKNFAITIKINKKGPSADEYYDLLSELYQNDNIFVHPMVFEEDSHKNLHIHGSFTLEDYEKLSFKQLVRKYKCHIYIKQITSEDKWINYCRKTTPNHEQQMNLINENHFYHYYGFI